MTLLKLQHIMSNEIAKRAFISRPPEPPAGILMGDPLSPYSSALQKYSRSHSHGHISI